MKDVGAHVSAAGGVDKAPGNAAAIGAAAFALFTRNQRQWAARPLSAAEIAAFREACLARGYAPGQILPHDSYLINLGHPEAGPLARSREALLAELRRCEALGLTQVNLHPGSSLGRIDDEACLERIAQSLDWALARSEGVTAVIENTAGQGSNLGWRFEQIAAIVAAVRHPERVGVCLDTAHAFAAGYDLATAAGYAATWEAFDRIIGPDRLKALHLNDSKTALGSRVDRHAPLGEGRMGLAPFRRIMADPRFDGLPLILETPEEARWPREIALLKGLAAG